MIIAASPSPVLPKMIQIEGTTLQRDLNSKGLVETNINKAQEYITRRKNLKHKFEEKDQRIENLENQVSQLWQALNNLKEQR